MGLDDFAISQTRPQSAIRRGQYKLIYFYEHQNYELYDIDKDIGEQHDLAAKLPTIADDLQRELKQQLADADARLPTLRRN